MRQIITRCIPGICLFAAGAACGWWYTRHTQVAELELAAAAQEVTIATLHKEHAELLEKAASHAAKTALANEQATNTAKKLELDAGRKLDKTAKESAKRIAAVKPEHGAALPGASFNPGQPGRSGQPGQPGLPYLDRPGPDSLVAPVLRMREEAVRAGNPSANPCAVSAGSSFCPY